MKFDCGGGGPGGRMRRLRLQRSFGVSQGCEIVGDKARRADSDDGCQV